MRGNVLHHLAARGGVGQLGLHQFHGAATGANGLLQGQRIGLAVVVMANHPPAGSGKSAAQLDPQAAGCAGDEHGRQRDICCRAGNGMGGCARSVGGRRKNMHAAMLSRVGHDGGQ